MKKIEVLILEEEDMVNGYIKQSLGGDRLLWTANHVVFRKKDGTVATLKDRWDFPRNESRATIALPERS